MTSAQLEPRCGGWSRFVSVPDDLDRLDGALAGEVRLPLGLYSSGQGPERAFDMGDEVERIELYEIVLTNGAEDDVCRFVNRGELVRLWSRLWLPDHVRRAWQPRLPLASAS